LGSLPFIQVDVSVRAPGIVRSQTERVELKAPVSGRIAEVLVHDNERVVEGQTVMVIAAGELDERLSRQLELRADREALLGDLQALLEAGELAQGIRSLALRHELAQFQVQLDAYRLAEAKAASELNRYVALADKGIATRQELDNVRYESERLRAESLLLREQTRTRWAARLKDEQIALADLASESRRMAEARSHHVVRAPATGVLVGFNGWRPGVQAVAGQPLGVISPSDALQVESFVSSRDIGQVAIGQTVRLQVDAFPYTQWGVLAGIVEAVGDDLLASEAQDAPGYYKVLIRPARSQLSLPNGAVGKLRKGLTLSARYVVARRSLLQVLYDDASAWFNPMDSRNDFSRGHP
jgi:HlyD family secretion protein